MGSAASYQLAKSGANVLGIDRYAPPHVNGSTHGGTRMTRHATAEGAEYVPLVTRSLELWRDIEQEVGYELLDQRGGLIMSVHDLGQNGMLDQTIAVANQYDIQHDELTSAQIQMRFPQFNLVGTEDGYYEPEAGILRPEKCVRAQLDLAKRYGATINTSEQVLSVEDLGNCVNVKTNKATYMAEKAIIAAGPWVNDLIGNRYASNFKTYRQVLYWFDLKEKLNYPIYEKLPVFYWEFGKNVDDFIYGFPMVDGPDGGMKVATGDYRADISPDQAKRDITQDEIDYMYDTHVKDRLPGLSRTCVKAASCLYTVTPDRKFVIGPHPEKPNLIVLSPCSGHGFKHSAAIGEIASQLVMRGTSDIDISKFSLTRF